LQGQYDFYSITIGPVSSTLQELKISVTPLGGDTDIYISTTNPYPNRFKVF
jgi:hypothetical protein